MRTKFKEQTSIRIIASISTVLVEAIKNLVKRNIKMNVVKEIGINKTVKNHRPIEIRETKIRKAIKLQNRNKEPKIMKD